MQINRCPKCGREPKIYCGEALLNGILRDVKIMCDDCWLYTGICETLDEAVEKWNKMTEGENE